MRVLVACESSGVVREAFRRRGHNAWSCDLLPAEDVAAPYHGVFYHFQRDVREVLHFGWDLMIAHPTCTYLTNSGVRWLHTEARRWERLDEGAAFFRTLLDAPIPYIAIENPIPHKYAVERIGRSYDQCVQPWMFGHPEQKATCLWLKNLPKLVPTRVVRDEMLALPQRERSRIHYASPGPDRWKLRSRTFAGLAEAMADQWTAHVQERAA